MYIYIYIYTYVYTHTYILTFIRVYIYIYIASFGAFHAADLLHRCDGEMVMSSYCDCETLNPSPDSAQKYAPEARNLPTTKPTCS